jgi:hypothetical protein
VKKAFWRYAYWRFKNRPISPLTEWLLIGWGVFWTLVCGSSLLMRLDVAGSDFRVFAWLIIGLVFLVAGYSRRTIRKVQLAGGQSALYRKRLEVLNA